jgi:hypothetical protein
MPFRYIINLQATGNDTCVNDHSNSGSPLSILVISRCVRYDIIFIRDQVWS